MIGNDIIDLNLAHKQSNWQRQGFIQKLFTEEEQSFIECSQNRESSLWLLWSMKEAVYKAVQRKYKLDRFYNPRHFNCTLTQLTSEKARGEVSFKDEAFETTSELFPSKIHSYTANTEFSYFSEKENIRSLLLQNIAKHYSLPLASINISKSIQGIPFITYLGDNLQIPFSLSHHGNYSAYALSLNMS
ncbi:phosphopantetheine--protein transferase domain-containing protein [Salegentibacter holothuriorum]|uniref:Phosphopantetheine--protein transferase domain-containing protein n=1 Tax=Salegentibacter holothuriorum TaxID=241145 RepID=A0A1T5ABE0_9FLAO|nr:4'-phosphopantetheinyl transferase superfamily protein [Salegentibacter holothuriorum]SKB32256.1 phosphopantetheine--protein transferase domain-containing protein [Salegentibacter holothuriorum]